MDDQEQDSSKVKTHEEIIKLFHELQSVEAKIKNPEAFIREPFVPITLPHEKKFPIEATPHKVQTTQRLEPTGEIVDKKKEEIQKPVLKKINTPEILPEKKTRWFDFLKLDQPDIQEPKQPVETVPEPVEVQTFRSTFILELDSSGNLSGFPLKKPRPEKKTSSESGETEEPATGIKGKLKHLTARFRRKSTEDSESSGGIGEKLKGLFRRKNKE